MKPFIGAMALLMLALPVPARAQANNSAYCPGLAELVRRYVGNVGGEGDSRPDVATLEAIDNCGRGNTAAGIGVLERKLRSNGVALPRRTAPG